MKKEKYNEFTRKYYEVLVQHCCIRIGDKQDTLDLVQDVFLILWEQIDKLDDANLKAWVWCVANNKIKDYYKTKNCKNKITYLEDLIVEPMDKIDIINLIERNVSDSEISFAQIKTLNQLAEKEQVLFGKFYIEKKTHLQIAQEYKISENAIAMRLYRIRKKIESFVKTVFILCGS